MLIDVIEVDKVLSTQDIDQATRYSQVYYIYV